MPRILGACLARHFLRKLISRLFLGPGVDLEPGENAAEKALLAASMIESVIHPLHLYILYIHKTSTTYSSVCFFLKAHDAFVFEANVLHLGCNWMAV